MTPDTRTALETLRAQVEARMQTTGRAYKLNNNHRACYARWIMRDVPELATFFQTREQGRVAQGDHD